MSGDEFDLVGGHFPYGIHRFYGAGHPRYFVMLREPIDRAVSHYYFIKACGGPGYVHPRFEDVQKNDLRSFYQIPRYQNLQTRFVAGMLFEYGGRYLRLNWSLRNWVLERAKYNLKNAYEAYGLKERFEESVELFASCADLEPQLETERYQDTPNRPVVSDLEESTREALRRANSLDMELYEFAVDYFGDQ